LQPFLSSHRVFSSQRTSSRTWNPHFIGLSPTPHRRPAQLLPPLLKCPLGLRPRPFTYYAPLAVRSFIPSHLTPSTGLSPRPHTLVLSWSGRWVTIVPPPIGPPFTYPRSPLSLRSLSLVLMDSVHPTARSLGLKHGSCVFNPPPSLFFAIVLCLFMRRWSAPLLSPPYCFFLWAHCFLLK